MNDFNAEARSFLRDRLYHREFIGRSVSFINFHVLLCLKALCLRGENKSQILLIAEGCSEPFFDAIFDSDYLGLNNYSPGGLCKIDSRLPAVFRVKGNSQGCIKQAIGTALNNPEQLVVTVLKGAQGLSGRIANQYAGLGNIILVVEILEKDLPLVAQFTRSGWSTELFNDRDFTGLADLLLEAQGDHYAARPTVIFIRSSWSQI
jgi:hypothetical protein